MQIQYLYFMELAFVCLFVCLVFRGVYDETLPEFLQELCFVFIKPHCPNLLANILGYINSVFTMCAAGTWAK